MAVSSEGNIWDDTDYILLVGQTIDPNTNEPTTPVPIVGGGSTSTLPDTVPYVDDYHPPQVLQYLLSIIKEQMIDLPDAYGAKKTKVAKAKIEIINATTGTNYKVDIKFESNSVNQGKFHLHLDGDLNQYGIPYYLYFKQDLVVPGANNRWNHILEHPEKVIKVTGVIQDDAEQAPAGSYQDTITVTITAVD
ncbi:MAG: spore coat protein U domain-containing protein [Sphaerochaeta sp.]|nr:spore coat protein U domain-containing protein [Sphaerochaeta sp.]